MQQLEINQHRIDFEEGQTVLEVASSVGIRIPTLCHHPDLSGGGSCRICLVEVEGSEHLVPACQHVATEGLRLKTQSPSVMAARRMVLRMLTSQGGFRANGVNALPTEFDRLLAEYDVDPPQDIPARYAVDSDPSPFLHVNLNQCILCTRCIRLR